MLRLYWVQGKDPSYWFQGHETSGLSFQRYCRRQHSIFTETHAIFASQYQTASAASVSCPDLPESCSLYCHALIPLDINRETCMKSETTPFEPYLEVLPQACFHRLSFHTLRPLTPQRVMHSHKLSDRYERNKSSHAQVRLDH